MNAVDLIRRDLGEDVLKDPAVSAEVPSIEALSPFPSLKTFIVLGRTNQFDFPTLPRGSYCLYVADGRRALRLTRKGKEIQVVLREQWDSLCECDPVKLASLVLKFFDGGIKSGHQVLRDAHALHEFEDTKHFGGGYVIDKRKLAKVEDAMGATAIAREGDHLIIRAVTLRGWMHEKDNLGIERIRVSSDGAVQLDKREVLCRRIFTSVPQIRY